MIKNIESGKVLKLTDLVKNKKGIVSSLSLIDDSLCNAKLFSVSDGESISAEMYNGDMVYLIIDGKMSLRIGQDEKILDKGDLICVNANIEHEIKAITSFKMIQLLVSQEGI